MDYQTFQIERRSAAEWVTLNRPDRLNAIDTVMTAELSHYFGALCENREVRVVVLRGAGKGFCSGMDLKEHADGIAEPPFGRGLAQQGTMSELFMRMRRCPQPIVTLIHGAAAGGGFALALASDIRIAGESARMNAAFIRVGLSACDMGTSYFLPRLVGVSVASELMLTGRFIEAPRALAVGLVSQVVPDAELEQAAQGYVDDMLAATPMGLLLTKDGLNMAIDSPSLEHAMAIENRQQLLVGRSEDFREAVRARAEGRKPEWKGK
ncbi:MAG: enoyl-CoA hydratase/isomerase family protein [Novosphingobium sp.]|nr:enoyl-CoA hydratase/isomerase family protein [Novosphingobium sp.]